MTARNALTLRALTLIAALMCGSVALARDTELLLEVEINGVANYDPAVVRVSSSKGLLLRLADLNGWGIHVPLAAMTLAEEGGGFVCATDIAGLRVRIDSDHQRLIIAASPAVLPSVRMRLNEDMQNGEPTPSVPGAFASYDVVANRDGARRLAAGQIGIGGSAGAWSATGNWQVFAEQEFSSTRLDTAVSRDWPDRMLSLRLGDAVTTPASWGRAVRFGGLQWGTDFRAQPDFIPFPLPAVKGEAVVPSVVDIYVNDSLRARREVAPGSFTFDDLPVTTGDGELKMVVRDSLGRERWINQPYFASPTLLRAGLSEYAVEIGAVREDYGLESFAYGRTAAVAGYRQGVTNRVTMGIRAEILKGHQTAGASIDTAVLPGLVLSASLARSEAERAGSLAQLGADVSHGPLSAGVRLRTISAEFRQLGELASMTTPRQELDAHLGWLAGRAGSVGLVFAEREQRGQQDVRVLSATYGVSLGLFGHLGAFVTRSLGGERAQTQLLLAFTRSVGDRTSHRLAVSRDDAGAGVGYAVNRGVPAGYGTGYHFEANTGSVERIGGGATLQRDAVTLRADAERAADRTHVQVSANGGVVLVGGHLAPVRNVTSESGFAVVEVPSQPGIPIYHDNHRVAVTDEHGFAVLQGLRPYEVNRLRIDPTDLPLDVSIARYDFSVRPYRHGGVTVRFPVAERGGAIVHLLLESRQPILAGTDVRVKDQRFTVAKDGAVYLEGVSGMLELTASWPGHRCTAHVSVPAGSVLPDLGSAICRETL